ncbi:DUF6248 family natural product biosynthesis protein [Micromonospora aurantiaca]|uniref:DUF6248 family natural product biosynthesis protein n=1 Tax=Micromonospora aurantiaca (nom. illeg.) TaxID=47850 RepID=UPI0033B6E079
MTTMPAHAAAWIHDVVLPPKYRQGTTDPSKCPCQGGPCGHCDAGRHQQCAVIAWGGAPVVRPETVIVDSRGYVAVARGVRSVDVWRSGRPCRWVCSCGCAPIGCEPPPATEPAYQLDLFALINPNRSTT